MNANYFAIAGGGPNVWVKFFVKESRKVGFLEDMIAIVSPIGDPVVKSAPIFQKE